MKKDKDLIPKGHYCYVIDYDNFNGDFSGDVPIIECPYREHREIVGVSLPYCAYLEKFGWQNNLEDGEFDKLVQHFGSVDAAFNNLPLDLLWDSCKECGENYDEDNE